MKEKGSKGERGGYSFCFVSDLLLLAAGGGRAILSPRVNGAWKTLKNAGSLSRPKGKQL